MVYRAQEKKQSLRPNTVLTTADTHLNPNNTHTDHSENIQEAINILQHYHNVKCEGRQQHEVRLHAFSSNIINENPKQNVNATLPCLTY